MTHDRACVGFRATPLTELAHAWDRWIVSLLDVWTDPIADEFVRDQSNCVVLAPGINAPSRYVAHANIADEWEVEIDVRVHVLGPYAVRVTVVPRSGTGVTSESLRKVPIATILSDSLAQVIFVRFEGGRILWGSNPAVLIMPPDLRGQWPNGDRVQDVLEWTALVYRLASALGNGPTAAVARAAGVSRATAGRMVAACRDRGLLSEFETPQFNQRFEMREVTLEDITFMRRESQDD